MDVVEVLRGTAASPTLIAASAAGAVAAVTALLTAVLWWTLGRPPARARVIAVLVGIGFVSSAVELTLLLLDGAPVTGVWPAVVLVRLLLLLGLALLPDPPEGSQRGSPLGVVVAAALTAGLAASAALGAPIATGALDTAPLVLAGGAGAAVLAVTITTVLVRLAGRRGDQAAVAAALVVLVAFAGPTAVVLAPEPLPPHQQTQMAVGDLTLDLTVAPVRPGTNEFHLYAFDPQRRPAPVRDVILEVDGHPDSRHELFPVSPDHHLSYVLELADRAPWTLRFTLIDPDGHRRSAAWEIEPPG